MKTSGNNFITKLFIFILIMSVAGCNNTENTKGRRPAGGNVSGEISWYASFEEGMRNAALEKKPVMVDFFADWCHWCRKLDKETYADERVVKMAEMFVCIKVDTENDRETPAKYQVRGLPTIFYLDHTGSPLIKMAGFCSADRMLEDMRAVNEIYKLKGKTGNE